ncbi:MAG: hypothetical protein PVI99_03255 [Anaerolineales bacterium]
MDPIKERGGPQPEHPVLPVGPEGLIPEDLQHVIAVFFPEVPRVGSQQQPVDGYRYRYR